MFLHGAAERGTCVEDVARQGLPKLLQDGDELSPAERAAGRLVAADFVVIAPQCPPFEVWDNRKILRLLDETCPSLGVDPQRVYLSGLSMGAFAAWTLGIREPRRFAALVPICGGGRIADISAAMAADPAGLRGLGIWAFHGAKDRVVPVEESERMVAELHRVGVSEARLTIYPDAEHDAWSATYANPELYRWMLIHKRSS